MPLKNGNRNAIDARVTDLKKMSGHDFAMEVARDLIILSREERAKAVRMLTVLDETITRECAAA